MSLLGLFLEGLLSFLSPCVLPLIPLYMSYLNGEGERKPLRVFLMTVSFICGILTVLFLLAYSADAARSYLSYITEVIELIGGTLLIFFGLHQSGIIHISFLDRELSLSGKLDVKKMSFFKAFLLGFVFCFAWTPCIGPMLASALLLAVSQDFGSLYILVYGAGLTIPFLLTGIFTTRILEFLKEKKKAFSVVMLISGLILLGYGGYMIYHGSSSVISLKKTSQVQQTSSTDNIFYDQDGNLIDLDENGKYVFLNFTATWCTYCEQEIPEYEKFAQNQDLTCYYVMSPYVNGTGIEQIKKYYDDHDMTVPIIVDENNILFSRFGLSAYPTLIVLSPEGEYIGYASGATDLNGFEEIYKKAQELNKQ